jgi:purine-binding chemotaxis protein CheW
MPVMNKRVFILFTIDDQVYALDVHSVGEIVQAAALTHVPDSPELLLGLLNVRGRIIPVLDIRKQLGQASRGPIVTDKIIIGRTTDHAIAFLTDDIETVVELNDDDIMPAAGMFPGMEDIIIGSADCNGRTILVYSLDQLFPGNKVNQVTDHLRQHQTMA